jgi:hypothetical protein
MKRHLDNLKSLIDMLSEDEKVSWMYMQYPEEKEKLIKDNLCQLVFKFDFNGDEKTGPVYIEERANKILETINSRYQYIIGGSSNDIKTKPVFTYQLLHKYVPWRCHETHFHPTFNNWLTCPITSMPEISEMFEKILEKMEN